jgi:hypothetical protein
VRRRTLVATGTVLAAAVAAASWLLFHAASARPMTTVDTTTRVGRLRTAGQTHALTPPSDARGPSEQAPASIDGRLIGFSDKARIVAMRNAVFNQSFSATVRDGHFTIDAIPPGPYIVWAKEAPLYEEAWVDVSSGKRTSVTLTSKGTALVAGRVTNLVTRRPLRGLVCQAGRHGDRKVVTDRDGRFRLDIAAGRPVRIGCVEPKSRPQIRGSMSVELATGSTQDLTIEMVAKRHVVDRDLDVGLSLASDPLPRVGAVFRDDVIRAGVSVGDRVMKVDGIEVSTFHPREVELLMHDHGIGERLELVVLRRDGREVNASVEVMERKREDE